MEILKKCRSNHKAENHSNLDRSGYGWAHNLWFSMCRAHLHGQSGIRGVLKLRVVLVKGLQFLCEVKIINSYG